MNEPMIVSSARGRAGEAASATSSARGWSVLGWIGFAFLMVGGSDFALAWFPLSLGNSEWEFGTVTQSFNGLPILVLGIGMVSAASEQLGRRWWRWVGSGVALVLLAWVLVGFVLWALNVGLAFATVPDELAVGVRKAVTKTFVQAVVYSGVLAYVVASAWRGRADGRRRPGA